jgi:hypothetical protein
MENESNKTAIDQMFDIIEGLAEYSPENPMLQSLIAAKPRLKKVEKEQHDKTSLDWFLEGKARMSSNKKWNSFEQYYNETYGGNK